MFIVIAINDYKQVETPDGYKVICFFSLMTFIILSMITNIGVVLDG
jgi:hypothetical protein